MCMPPAQRIAIIAAFTTSVVIGPSQAEIRPTRIAVAVKSSEAASNRCFSRRDLAKARITRIPDRFSLSTSAR
ncbi:hypothetical protein D3C81_1909130 [compost metagenome]